MEKTIIKFVNTEIEKHKFHQYKKPIFNKKAQILTCKIQGLFGKKGFKCLIRYKDVKKIKRLCIFPPKMTAYRRDFDEIKYMSFFIKEDLLLGKYDEIWQKVKNSIKKRL